MGENDTYDFVGQECAYTLFRPNWNQYHATKTLKIAGLERDPLINPERDSAIVVASIGAGTGADAALFKRLGCRVILVEPNKRLLEFAERNLSDIRSGTAEFVNSDALNTGILPGSVDVIVVAQAAHVLKSNYSMRFASPGQKSGSVGGEELIRRHFAEILKDKDRSNVSIWYYNPDPKAAPVRELHDILSRWNKKYSSSKTQLINAEYFKLKHLQPWLNLERAIVSDIIKEQTITLKRDDIETWICSYSFKPDHSELKVVVETLKKNWFDKFNEGGALEIPYVGMLTQGPLRQDAFDITLVAKEIQIINPLQCEVSP